MIVLFTDFGWTGPYVGQVKAVIEREAPGVPVIDLMHDAPMFQPQASAYLLASLTDVFPDDAVFLCVVDPGVGGSRDPVIVTANSQRFVGPENGLFSIVARRAATVGAERIEWQPDRLSSTFHGRDLFAPVASRIARGQHVSAVQMPSNAVSRPEWPDDLQRIIYVDAFGNATTGFRARQIAQTSVIDVNGHSLVSNRTYSALPRGTAFWYENSSGLIEFAVNQGNAQQALGLAVGSSFTVSPEKRSD